MKANVLHGILERVSSEEELKYARLGLELFKKQGIKLNSKAASLFIKVGVASRPSQRGFRGSIHSTRCTSNIGDSVLTPLMPGRF